MSSVWASLSVTTPHPISLPPAPCKPWIRNGRFSTSPLPPLTLTARLQPSDGHGPGSPIPKGRPIWNLHRQGSPLRPSPEAAATLDTEIITCQCLITPRCQIADARLSTAVVYEGGGPTQPDQTRPAQPNSIHGRGESKPHVHDRTPQEPPRVRKETGRGGNRAGEGKTKRRKPPPSSPSLSTSPLSNPHPCPARPTFGHGFLSPIWTQHVSEDPACASSNGDPSHWPCRPANNDPQTLSSQPAPCLPSSTRHSTAGQTAR